MKAVIAMFKHETNTYSPVPTPLERFGKSGPYFDTDARDAFRGTRTAMGAFMQMCEESGIDYETPVAADARPSGPVPAAVYQALCDKICAAVERGCDALFLDLHGAMVAEHTDDGEGALLKRLRALRPDLPIAVALDMHANLTQDMVDHCTIIAGYRTYPHIDHYETGLRAARPLLQFLAGKNRPVMAWGRLPMLVHTLRMGTHEEPFHSLMLQAAASRPGLLDTSVFGGFPLADIPHPCFSVLVVSDADQELARRHTLDLLHNAWEQRDRMIYHAEPLGTSIARAKACTQGPVLLIDHADNCSSGGTQDVMHVLREALRQGLKGIAMFAVCDPESVAKMIEAGVGNTLTLRLGGKTDIPRVGLTGQPLSIRGKVKLVSDGTFVVSGPLQTGVHADMGRTAVLQTPEAEIVVCERHYEPWDLGCFRSVGIEPTHKKYLILKSRMHYRAAFAPIAHTTIECDGSGVTSSNYELFDFDRLNRPVFPLDEPLGASTSISAMLQSER